MTRIVSKRERATTPRPTDKALGAGTAPSRRIVLIRDNELIRPPRRRGPRPLVPLAQAAG